MNVSRTKKLVALSALALGMSVVGEQPVQALTQTANLSVSASVTAVCTIATTPVNFGPYDLTSAVPTDGTGTVDINCSSGSPVYVTLGQGSNPDVGSSDASPLRQMSAGGPDALDYGLFSDAGRTTVWGNTQATGVSRVGSGVVDSISVYGRIPAGQAVMSGAYADSVLATVNY